MCYNFIAFNFIALYNLSRYLWTPCSINIHECEGRHSMQNVYWKPCTLFKYFTHRRLLDNIVHKYRYQFVIVSHGWVETEIKINNRRYRIQIRMSIIGRVWQENQSCGEDSQQWSGHGGESVASSEDQHQKQNPVQYVL